MPSNRVIISTFLAAFAITDSFGHDAPKTIAASRTQTPPAVDGFLNEEQWNSIVGVSDFLQFYPQEGAEATEQTSVKVLYDDHYLYIGVKCYDSDPSGIVSQLTRRDRTVQSDRFSVMIDSYHDHNTAFLFSGSVSGVQSDGILSQDGMVYDIQWDAVWKFHAQIIPEGWSAEFAIPFTALRFEKKEGDYVWGINFRRFIARKQETVEWVMVRHSEAPIGTISSVSKMGHLSGLSDILPPLNLVIAPYGLSSMSYLSQQQPFPLQKKFAPNCGVDIKYGLTNNFTLDIAINPDFGQVEVDQAVLNLTVFETFYPEKRPFFLEGSQILSFGNMFDNRQLRLFYSRRIGRRPPYQQPTSGYLFLDAPQTTTILGAAKLTGKTDNGLAVGALTALTDEEKSTEENIQGTKGRTVLFEPRATYNVVRLKQDILENSSLGIIATGTFKEHNFPILTGGVDWNLRFDGNTYAVDGYLAGSNLRRATREQLSGSAGKIGIGKLKGKNWLAFSLYNFASKNFSIDELGFFGQPCEHGGFTQITYKEDFASEPFRRYAISLQHDYAWNWDGTKTLSNVEVESVNEFTNFWGLKLNYYHFFPSYDDASRGIVGLYKKPSSNLAVISLQTDSRKSAFITIYSLYKSSTKNMNYVFSSIQLTLRPNTWMEYAPAFSIARTRKEEAWPLYFYTANGRNLFGDRDIDYYDFSLRGTITFTRTISFQFFTQILLAKGQYYNFKELVAPDQLVDYPYDKNTRNPDFNRKTINANVVFRWEYLPGSTFFLVWTQARFDYLDKVYDRTLRENFSKAFKLPMDNVILAKLTYWWSL